MQNEVFLSFRNDIYCAFLNMKKKTNTTQTVILQVAYLSIFSIFESFSNYRKFNFWGTYSLLGPQIDRDQVTSKLITCPRGPQYDGDTSICCVNKRERLIPPLKSGPLYDPHFAKPLDLENTPLGPPPFTISPFHLWFQQMNATLPLHLCLRQFVKESRLLTSEAT